MRVINYNPILPQEEVHRYFILEGQHLYRKLDSGAAVPVKSMDGSQAVTIFKGHRLRAVDVAWCLIHGNWPQFPVVQIGRDPYNFAPGNLYAARVKLFRYRETVKGSIYYHPLSKMGHTTSERCRAHWEMLVVEWYSKDSGYVARVEAYERERREAYLRETGALRKRVTETRNFKTSRPKAIEGREWHWVKDKWIDIPVAIHVCDDYRVRIAATLAGCTEFRFDPVAQQVFAYLPDGSKWTPAKG